MKKINYPLKFEPILQEKIWGGEKLRTLLYKKTIQKNIGESWEISGVAGNISIVANGELKGESLESLLTIYKDTFVGEKVFEAFAYQFPLLLKFIDAKDVLSLQLHPNDALAKERHNSFGKTEMWYVMQADQDANLIVGFKEKITKEEYLEKLKNKALLSILNVDQVAAGDVYFIPTGRIHAIGAGVLLAEIQQTSDITYRIYDWDRQDAEGNYRELHTELAIDAIDYKVQKSYKSEYQARLNASSNIIDCAYFTTNIIAINKSLHVDNSDKDSFVIYMCVSGKVEFHYGNDSVEELLMGETILMPASLNTFELLTNTASKLLEVYIK